MNAVDTHILVYSLDRNEPFKQAKAQALLIALRSSVPPTVLLWQVLGELVQQLRYWRDKGKLTGTEFDQHVQAYRHLFPLALPTTAIVDHAPDLAARYSLSHWDSMLLGACKASGVSTLYTEDMGAPRMIDVIQLVNPLV
jgi:predicted nucleic acid-binding protein